MIEINFIEIPSVDVTEGFLFSWFTKIVELEDLELGDIELFFCSDDYILRVNRESLNHDYYTDIITFDYRVGDIVSGDLFISLDRITENAATNGVPFMIELYRVCAHGLLHICGYGDKTEGEIQLMRSKEDACLALIL